MMRNTLLRLIVFKFRQCYARLEVSTFRGPKKEVFLLIGCVDQNDLTPPDPPPHKRTNEKLVPLIEKSEDFKATMFNFIGTLNSNNTFKLVWSVTYILTRLSNPSACDRVTPTMHQ